MERGRIVEARIAFGGMAATPKRAAAAEQALAGREWDEAAAQAAMAALADDYAPITDMRAGGAYRRSVARNLLYRFWLETSGRKVATQVVEYAV
jgi:xanthine dehydrogenase small subunit